MKRKEIVERLLDKVSIVDSSEAAMNLVSGYLKSSEVTTVGFVNAHAVNLCYSDPVFFFNLLQCDFLFRDGVGISWLLERNGVKAGFNMNGTDFIPSYLARERNKRIALWGGLPSVAQQAAARLNQSGLRVNSVLDGYQDFCEYRDEFDGQAPDIIVLGMGMPRQEALCEEMGRAYRTDTACVVFCGGAIIDFISGNVARAPSWVRAMRCEWIFRLIQEPVRLWRRYVLGNFCFLAFLLSRNR